MNDPFPPGLNRRFTYCGDVLYRCLQLLFMGSPLPVRPPEEAKRLVQKTAVSLVLSVLFKKRPFLHQAQNQNTAENVPHWSTNSAILAFCLNLLLQKRLIGLNMLGNVLQRPFEIDTVLRGNMFNNAGRHGLNCRQIAHL